MAIFEYLFKLFLLVFENVIAMFVIRELAGLDLVDIRFDGRDDLGAQVGEIFAEFRQFHFSQTEYIIYYQYLSVAIRT